MGWKFIIKGILNPNTKFPLTAHPWRYKTKREYRPTAKKLRFPLDRSKSGWSKNVKTGTPLDRIAVPVNWIIQTIDIIVARIPKVKETQYVIGWTSFLFNYSPKILFSSSNLFTSPLKY